jgi:hypothetical protein
LTLVMLPVLLNENASHTDRPSVAAAVAPGGELAATLRAADPSSSGTSEGKSSVAADAAASGGAAAAPASHPTTSTDPPPGFLSGPTTGPPPSVVAVAVPGPLPATFRAGKASFRRWAPGAVSVSNPCATPYAKAGAKVTVTNQDNGRSATCVVVARSALDPGQIIVLDTSVFEQIADLGASPIPVTISW